MTVLEEQLQSLQKEYPQATMQGLGGNQHLVAIPDIKIPQGWSRSSVTIKFIVPVGYPVAKPDCFWTDADLRVANGNLPRSTGANPIPGVGGSHLWFSWHLASWNPNVDSLLTYVNVIRKRLSETV